MAALRYHLYLASTYAKLVLAVLGVAGNLSSVPVLLSGRYRSGSYGRLLLSLSACDLAVVASYLGMHLGLRTLRGADAFAFAASVPLSGLAVTASVFLTAAICVERYRAVSRPLRKRSDSTMAHA